MEPILGIDLGTTNSEVAFIYDGNAEVLKDGDDGIMPSCVGLDEKGNILVGLPAKNQALIAPERTVMSIKRKMGTSERIVLNGNAWLPQEISAVILKALKARAEKVLGKNVRKAVITVPAYFTDAQRKATREAGEIAGLEVVRIINEPTAAALAYESEAETEKTILVYDLGGGTFDVSIVKIEKGVVEVLSSTGDNHLGGDDFDDKIVDFLLDYAEEELGLDLTQSPVGMARLKRAAEKAKIELSNSPFARIEEDHIGRKKGKDIHLSCELSREEFVEMINEDLTRTMDAVSRALDDSKKAPAEIDRIILVGGSTRIPAIAEMLEDKIGKRPHGEIDPDLCVALGASMQAGREMGLDHSNILLDITPYTFGTSALGDMHGMPYPHLFVPLIRRNTKLPASRTEAFYTIHDNQESARIKIYQGESTDALENVCIGEYMFNLTKAPQNSTILLHFDLDINGILKIKAVEKATGKSIDAVIENAFARFSEEDLSDARKKIDDAWGETDGFQGDGKVKGKDGDIPEDILAVLDRAKEKLSAASEEDREEMVNIMEDIRTAAAEKNMEAAAKAIRELEDILFYIG